MQHWVLNSEQFDRVVFRAVKRTPYSGSWPITAKTQYLLYEEGFLNPCEKQPNEEDVFEALSRLIQRQLVEKYVDVATGGIRYCICPHSRR